MQQKIYWVGTRKSDIANVKDITFYGSITIFGDGKDNNYAYCLQDGNLRVNHNVPDEEEDMFFYRTILALIKGNDDVRFYFYNPQMVYNIPGLAAYKDYFLAINDKEIMDAAKDKIEFYNGPGRLISQVEKYRLHRTNCDYNALLLRFHCNRNSKFIFQAHVSSGGNGTYVVEEDAIQDVKNLLDPADKESYLVSVYREQNIPINIHAIIFANHILLTPGSVQIMKQDDHRLLYRGADFCTYQKLPAAVKASFKEQALKICRYYQERGYRGVCGIDGMVCKEGAGDKVYMLEFNNRFQASTGLLNLAFAKAGYPSIQYINLSAFEDKWDPKFEKIEEETIGYSNFFYIDNGTVFHSSYLHNVYKNLVTSEEKDATLVKNNRVVCVEDDGYQCDEKSDALGYLYRVTFHGSITAINPEGGIWINENICEPDKKNWHDYICPQINAQTNIFKQGAKTIRDFLLRLKISLLTQGVVIDEAAKNQMIAQGGLRPATNNAIDIKIDVPDESNHFFGKSAKYLVVNAPVDILFVELSPFHISINPDEFHEGKGYILTYYGERLIDIAKTYPLDPVALQRETVNGKIVMRDRYTSGRCAPQIPYSEVGFLSTDRLRLHLTNKCYYKRKDENGIYLGCKFCNIVPTSDAVGIENIEEVVQAYCRRSKEIGLTHFLIGGQTVDERDTDNNVIQIIHIIRKYAPFAPIYAMTIPYSNQMIREMYMAGLTQIAFNIEVFDDNIAKELMPGKRQRTRKEYLNSLKYATRFFGRLGNVRSMVIVGLEPRASLIEGIREFVAAGIQPILSVFRPLPETPLRDWQAPPLMYLLEVYDEILQICLENNLHPGPDCVNCQNNTLSLPVWLEDSIK